MLYNKFIFCFLLFLKAERVGIYMILNLVNAVADSANVVATDVVETSSKVPGEFIGAVVLTGLLVVFLALILLVVFVKLFGMVFDFIKSKKSKMVKSVPQKNISETVKPVISEKNVAPPEVEDGISDEIVAVITAAVESLNCGVDIKYSLRSIKKVSTNSARSIWANAGNIENSRPF